MAGSSSQEISFQATKSSGKVSALLMRPKNARWILVLGHGAGAGMRHKFMEAIVGRLAEHEIATFRYQFPFMERGTKRPDPRPILLTTVRSAVDAAIKAGGDVPLLAGGKSMGGRMTSTAASKDALPGVLGLAFFGFPLHAPGRDSDERGAHLTDVGLPMLFLQGTRDRLARLDLLQPLLERVKPRPTLHLVESADHGFHVTKKSGRTDDEVLDEMCSRFSDWVSEVASA